MSNPVWSGDETLVICLYGESGIGKTPVGHTSPAPRLILDSENGSKFIRGRKIRWDPMSEAPPEPGDWDTCVVACRDFGVFEMAYKWLNSGQHPFRSVSVDSLSELQKRCKDAIFAAGEGQGSGAEEDMNERRWGVLLQRMEKVVRELRDLTMHPTNPIQCVVLLCLEDEKKGKQRPLIQGGLAMSLPGFVDVIGYMSVDMAGVRTMAVHPNAMYIAKDRTSEAPSGGISAVHGSHVAAPIDLSSLIDTIYKENTQ